MVKNEEIKRLVEEAVSWACSSVEMSGENDAAAALSAQISIAKSLAALAGLLEKATNGKASINTYDTSNPVL